MKFHRRRLLVYCPVERALADAVTVGIFRWRIVCSGCSADVLRSHPPHTVMRWNFTRWKDEDFEG